MTLLVIESEFSSAEGTTLPSHHTPLACAQHPVAESPTAPPSSPESARNSDGASEADTATSVSSDEQNLAARNNEPWAVPEDERATTSNYEQVLSSEDTSSTLCIDRSINAVTESPHLCNNEQLVKSDEKGFASCDSEERNDSEHEGSFSCNDNQGCPYIIGLDMFAFEEEPPEPRGLEYDTTLPEGYECHQEMPHRQLCYEYQTRHGQNLANQPTHLRITSVLRSGVDRGPQVVVVNDSMVAKIYDPLFYDPDECLDAVHLADEEHSRETAAYTHLQQFSDLADILPAYFGSYTTQMTAKITIEGRNITYEYPVHMILVEYIQGCCMRDAIELIPEQARYTIFKQCMDADMRLRHAGVRHDDVCPRNVILVGTDLGTPNVQVKIIDFDRSIIFYHPRYRYQGVTLKLKERARKWDRLNKLPNPIYYWWHQTIEFSGWFPDDEDENNNVTDTWMWEEYKGDNRYIPCRWNPERPDVRPKYVDEP
jgi:hypothetical protein